MNVTLEGSELGSSDLLPRDSKLCALCFWKALFFERGAAIAMILKSIISKDYKPVKPQRSPQPETERSERTGEEA